MMSIAVILLLVGGATSKSITYSKETYHVQLIRKSGDCISPRDVHHLTGTIDDEKGGMLMVHTDNGTLADYTMHIGGLRSHQSPYAHTMNASIVCKGKTINLSGMFLIAHGFTAEFYFEEAGVTPPSGPIAWFLHGPNPPPPPPTCTTTGAASQSDCDAVGPGCSWCQSKDGVHKLCFLASHKPDPTSWDCDR